jgi:hypothetical protein
MYTTQSVVRSLFARGGGGDGGEGVREGREWGRGGGEGGEEGCEEGGGRKGEVGDYGRNYEVR